MAHFSLAGLQSVSDAGFQVINTGLSRVVAFVFLLLFFYYSSALFWQVFYPHEFRLPVSVVKAPAPKPQAQMKWQWFSDTQKVNRAKPAAPSKLEATLIGVISQGEGEGEGIALISIKGKGSKIFKVGDEVAESRFLKSVGPDYANLERDGNIEVLRIKKFNVFKDKGAQQEDTESSKRDLDKEKQVENFRATITKEPLKIMDYMQFEKRKSKHGEGFMVKPKGKKHKELFDALGLEKGDVIVSANGKKVAELTKNPTSLDKLLEDGVSLQVIRDGILTDVYVY